MNFHTISLAPTKQEKNFTVEMGVVSINTLGIFGDCYESKINPLKRQYKRN